MRLKIINRLNNRPFATPFKRSLPATESQDEKVTVHSVIGDKEANWQIDRYKLMVVVSILSVFSITGGIVWLASGGGKNANAATPYPTGELDFSERKGTTLRDIPYPSVKNSDKRLLPAKPSSTPKISVSPTEKTTPTPTPTTAPEATSTPVPTATPTPTPTAVTSTAIPSLTDTPTPTPTPN